MFFPYLKRNDTSKCKAFKNRLEAHSFLNALSFSLFFVARIYKAYFSAFLDCRRKCNFGKWVESAGPHKQTAAHLRMFLLQILKRPLITTTYNPSPTTRRNRFFFYYFHFNLIHQSLPQVNAKFIHGFFFSSWLFFFSSSRRLLSPFLTEHQITEEGSETKLSDL